MLRTVYTDKSPAGVAYYAPVMIGPGTVAQASSRAETVRDVLGVLGRLDPDDYTNYLSSYYANGLDRFGESWCYSDICTVLLSASRLLKPQRYLEIGVRRGRSMAMVVASSPEVQVVGFDMWMADYAGIENPGPDFVHAEMARIGHKGKLELITGNSHETVPRFLADNPGMTFDIITVDGDHSEQGALDDLRTVIPRLSPGGLLVFDDVVHPQHPFLRDVWRQAVDEDGGLQSHEFTELGYGVAIALRVGEPGHEATRSERLLSRSRQGLKRLRSSLRRYLR